MAILRQKKVRAQYHIQHCTLQAFEQFEALNMHKVCAYRVVYLSSGLKPDGKYTTRPGFEASTS